MFAAGVCKVSYETKNKSRYVHGPVDVECGIGESNSPPFGNWGVESDGQRRKDGFQFPGWCKDRRVCEGGNCKTYCTDDWYEWNSCTSKVPKFAPPNSDFYNHSNHTQQKAVSNTKPKVHGGGSLEIIVSCPTDSDGDYYPDSGGCLEVVANGISVGGQIMDLWELDHNVGDDFVGRLRFPTLKASINTDDCDTSACSGGSDGTYKDKYPNSSISSVSAQAAIRVTSASFDDFAGNCCDPLSDPGCQD